LAKLSLSSGTLYHLPLRMVFSLAREAGFQGLELVYGLEVMARGPGFVRRLIREYELPVLSIHPPILPYPGHRRPALVLPRLVELAEEIGCRLVVLHPPKTPSMDTAIGSEFVEGLARWSNHETVAISLENPAITRPSDRRHVLGNLPDLRRFADEWDFPLTFDTSHAGTSPHGVMDGYRLVRDRLVNVHFSDLIPRPKLPALAALQTFLVHHQQPGEGILPLRAFLRELLTSGYTGPVTVEVSPTAVQAWSLAHIRRRLSDGAQFILQSESEARNGS
jgi:sugar phosphate isomerase/epimerase